MALYEQAIGVAEGSCANLPARSCRATSCRGGWKWCRRCRATPPARSRRPSCARGSSDLDPGHGECRPRGWGRSNVQSASMRWLPRPSEGAQGRTERRIDPTQPPAVAHRRRWPRPPNPMAKKRGAAGVLETPVPSRQGRPHRPRAERLDPEAGALLKVFNLAQSGSITRYTLRRQRLAWQAAAVALGHAEPVPRVRALRIPGPGGLIEARVYWPPSAKAGAVPAFLWFHGGAFLVGGIPTADTICRRLARSSGAAVIAVRYRLAPEHDLYAGRADCLAAVEWIAREGASLGIDTTRLAVGGDSAGGNLAAAVAQRCAERGAPALRLQVLVYPATNLRDEQASKQENARG